MKKTHLILIFILFLSSFLRLYKLSSLPPALYWDEASLGYNAFSILSSGIDEHGVKFPITHFLAYGDAKPPIYIYLISIFMAVFGVNELSVRLPSAVFGILATLIMYFLSKELGKFFFDKTQKQKLEVLGLFSSFLFAVSPWHLQMSRAAFEANVALTFFLLGLLLFFKATIRPNLYILSAISFVATWYTFNAYRLFLPPFLLVLGILYTKTLLKNYKWVLLSTILALGITAPLIPFVLSDQASLRFNEVNIFKDHAPVIDANLRIEENNNAIWAKIIFNRRILYLLEFIDGFFDHLKPDFLFFGGDENPRLGIRDMGMMYLIELPLLLLGSAYVYSKKNKLGLLLFWWAVWAIMPSAIARETPHALRSLQLIPVLYLLVAISLTNIWFNQKKYFYFCSLMYLGFFTYYLNTYYNHYGKQWANSWQYGYKQMVSYIDSVKDNYDRVYITDSYGRPHTYMLFYLKYDPKQYVNNRVAYGDAFGFTQTDSFDKYYFIEPNPQDLTNHKWLFVVDNQVVVDENRVKEKIRNPKGEIIFIIYE